MFLLSHFFKHIMIFVCFCYPRKTNKGSTITRKIFDFHLFIFRAANETRTRDPQLGKLMLYQLSYCRTIKLASAKVHHYFHFLYFWRKKNRMEKLILVKVGGKVVEEEASLNRLLADFSNIDGLKLLVHGGGRMATEIAGQLGIESQMIEGRRITDATMLKIVTMVYAGWINKTIVARLQALGIDAIGLTGADMNMIRSIKRPIEQRDYGFVGDVKNIRLDMLHILLMQKMVPVIAPITHDMNGQLLNTNADTIASELAKSLASRFDVTLIYCFEKDGVLCNKNDEESVIPLIDRSLFNAYKENGVIQGGMIPKLENAFKAVDAGVKEVIITKAIALGKNGGTRIN